MMQLVNGSLKSGDDCIPVVAIYLVGGSLKSG